jgi:hypothetical protein
MSQVDLKKLAYNDAENLKRVIDAFNLNMESLQHALSHTGNSSTPIVDPDMPVDQLDTSLYTKVQNFLSSSTASVNLIKISGLSIQFITASTDGLTTVQLSDRRSKLLYWKDDTHAVITIENTALPVTTYVYTEQVKMS